MFKNIWVTVNERYNSYNITKSGGYIYYGNNMKLEITDPLVLYSENFVSKEFIGNFEELPNNLKTIITLSRDLVKNSKDEFTYRFNTLKGNLDIEYNSFKFGNQDNIHLYVSNAAFYANEEIKELISTLNDPNNQLINDMMKDIKSDYELFKKVNVNNDTSKFKFKKSDNLFDFSINLFSSKILGDQRIQNLIDNRLYSKYFITEPLK